MKSLRPDECPEFEPAEFAAAFELAVRSGEMPELDEPTGLDIELMGDDGRPVKLQDTPFNRAGIALRRHYGQDEARFLSALFRFRALMDLVSKNALGEWVRTSIRTEGASRIHPAVLDVASRMRLSRNGRFAVNKFVDGVAKVASERYADLPEWPLG